MVDMLAKTEAAGRFEDINLTWRSSANLVMTYGKVLPCSKQYCHDRLVCAFAHPGETMCRRDPTRFAYTGIACPDKKVNNEWADTCLADSICILKDWLGSQAGHCKRGKSCPYSHNTFEYWLHPTRYHTQLCDIGAQCSRPICFFAHSSAELRKPNTGTSVPQDVLATARLAVSAEVARQNLVHVDTTQELSALQAIGKAVALAVADTALQQAAINPAQNIMLSNAMAAELLLGLLAKLHLSKKQQNIKQTSSRRAVPKRVQDDQTLFLLQPRRNRFASPGTAASERQQLALHSFSKAATDPGNGTRLSQELVLLQAQLQSAAGLDTTNAAPSSVWALQSALCAGQQREEVHPQPFCAESPKAWVVPSDSPYLSGPDPTADTAYFQGPTSSDGYCPVSNETWSHFARSSTQAGTVGVIADGQLRRNAFDEGSRGDYIPPAIDIYMAAQHQ